MRMREDEVSEARETRSEREDYHSYCNCKRMPDAGSSPSPSATLTPPKLSAAAAAEIKRDIAERGWQEKTTN